MGTTALALLPVQNSVVCSDLQLQPLLIVEESLIVAPLLLDLPTYIRKLGLQLPNDRTQILQLNVMPVLGIIQGVLQAPFLHEREVTVSEKTKQA